MHLCSLFFLFLGGDKLKKIICFILCFLLVTNNIYTVFADSDIHGGSEGSFDPNDPTVKYPELFDKDGHIKPVELPGQKLFGHMILGDGIGSAVAPILSTIDDFLSTFDNSDDAISIDKGGSTIHFHERFLNELNQAVQDKVHALDGYWLFEPTHSFSELVPITKAKFHEKYSSYDIRYIFVDSDAFDTSFLSFLNDTCSVAFFPFKYGTGSSEFVSRLSPYVLDKNVSGFDSEYYIALYKNSPCIFPKFGSLSDAQDLHIYDPYINNAGTAIEKEDDGITGYRLYQYINYSTENMYGSPFRIFYSFEDLQNFWNNGRTYAPQLPSTTISIPIKYINNSVSLPDITYNINTTNKTEVEIQNEYNTTLNNYLNDLNKFSDGGSGNTPTPTPSGGGSGDFGDGTTPTPKPDFGDGSDLTDTNDCLKKIYEWLQSFGDTHSKFEKTITDYIEANDGKLDQIIEAINALSDGKTEDEKNGCKYDFTALSDFMTKLWNESDKKFDKMVELLEENNKYQKKLVNSLNEIKAILVTQTIMDVFQDRSQQTAEKAKDKFPTSLPWDIALVVNAMSAEPEKPQFNLPIQIKSLNINEEIHVDLASGEWEKLAKTCRYLLSILFILLMIQLSRKLFSNGGDD